MLDAQAVRSLVTAAFVNGVAAEFVKGRVLDVGCGNKPYRRCFPDAEWVGLDVRPVGDIIADCDAIPCEDASFDTVLCTDVLHLCAVPQDVLCEVARVLKPGGHLVLSAPNCANEDGASFWRFPVKGIERLAWKAGFEPLFISADGRTIATEFAAMTGYEKYGFPQPNNIGGWLDAMDKRYPAMTLLVARKKEG